MILLLPNSKKIDQRLAKINVLYNYMLLSSSIFRNDLNYKHIDLQKASRVKSKLHDQLSHSEDARVTFINVAHFQRNKKLHN